MGNESSKFTVIQGRASTTLTDGFPDTEQETQNNAGTDEKEILVHFMEENYVWR